MQYVVGQIDDGINSLVRLHKNLNNPFKNV